MSKKISSIKDPRRALMPRADEWEELVSGMDIPDIRKVGFVESARWFVRNGGIRNKNHPNFEAAMKLAKNEGLSTLSDDERYAIRMGRVE